MRWEEFTLDFRAYLDAWSSFSWYLFFLLKGQEIMGWWGASKDVYNHRLYMAFYSEFDNCLSVGIHYPEVSWFWEH